MQRVFSLAKLELKQQLRSPLCWLLLLLSSFLAYDGYYSSPNLWENLHWATDTMSLVVLLLALLSAMAAGRERRQRVGETIESSSVSNWQLSLGQWLGLALLAALTSLLIVVILAARALALGGTFSLGAPVFFWLLVYFPMQLLGATVGLTLGSLIPSLFVSLPMTVGWWFALGSMSVTGELARILPGVWADLLDFTAVSPTVPGAAFGFLPFHRFLFNRVAQAGFMLLLLGALMLVHRRYRERRIGWQPVLVVVLALTTTALSFAAFTADLAAAKANMIARFGYTELNEAEVRELKSEWQSMAQENPAPTAVRYQLRLTFNPDAHGLQVNADLTLRNAGNTSLRQLIFTLGDEFAVEQAAWQGQPANVTSSTAFGWRSVALSEPLPPGAAGVLTLSYRGDVWEWTTRWDGHDPELMSFVSSEGIFLPPHFCWYPAPGLHMVASARWARDIFSSPVEFQVTTEGSKQPVFTNLEGQSDGSFAGRLLGLLVVAGDWEQSKTENITLLHAPDRLLDDYITELQQMYEFASNRLGTLPENRVTAVTMPNWFYGEVDGRDTQTALIGEKRLNLDPRPQHQLWQRQSMLERMLGCWYQTLFVIGPDRNETDLAANDARLGLTSYLWSLYRETLDGQSGSLEQEYTLRASISEEDGSMPAMAAGQLYSTYSAQSNAIWLKLERARRVAGEAGLTQRLGQLMAQANRPPTVIERP